MWSSGNDKLSIVLFFCPAPPPPPTGLKADDVKAKSMTISWQPLHNPNGIITGYQVSYTSHGGRERFRVFLNTTSTELKGLKPHTQYTIRVSAKTATVENNRITVNTPKYGEL